MLNNPVLDIAIGLIFIYLLYSLLATTIKELVATVFAYRGRMLERGLEQMLDGKNYSYYWWDKAFMYLVLLFKRKTDGEAEVNPVRKKASQHCKAVLSKFGKSKPAEQSVGTDEHSSMHNKIVTYCKSSEKKILKNSKLCKKASMLTAEVTSHTLYLRSSEQSMFSKKPAYLTSDTFSDILIDLFSPDGSAPVLLKDIAIRIHHREADVKDPLNSETARILNLYLAQANGDLVRFKLLIEKWYDDTMDRVTGWYKKQAFRILLIIGFVLAVLFNVSTIEIVQKLSSDKEVRNAMVNSASDYIKNNKENLQSGATETPQAAIATKDINVVTDRSADSLKNVKIVPAGSNSDSLERVKKQAAEKALLATKKKLNATDNTAVNDPNNGSSKILADDRAANKQKIDSSFENVKKGIKKIDDLYSNTIKQQNTTLGLGWGDYGFEKDSLKWVKDSALVYKGDTALAKNPARLKSKIGAKPDPASLSFKIGINNDSAKWNEKYRTAVYGDTLSARNPELLVSQIGSKPVRDDIMYKIFFVLKQLLSFKKLLGILITAFAISMGAPFWFDLLNKFVNLRVAGNKPNDKDTNVSKTASLNKNPEPNSFA